MGIKRWCAGTYPAFLGVSFENGIQNIGICDGKMINNEKYIVSLIMAMISQLDC